MKLSFSTLGCPDFDWSDIYSLAKDFGFSGIELRGLGNSIFSVHAKPFSAENINITLSNLQKMRLEIPCISSGCCLRDRSRHGETLAELREYIDLAEKLGAKYIRVLGDLHAEADAEVDDGAVIDGMRQILPYAEEHGVVLLEAMKSVFEPSFDVLRKTLPRLGTLRRATLSYCQYSSRYDKFKAGEILNAFNPALSNGALMDIGVYCVHPAALLFGMPKAVHASCVKLSNGVDGAGSALLEYDGMTVEVLYSKIADGALGSEFQGEAGSLVVDHISMPQELTLHLRKQPAEVLPTVHEVQSMRFEIAAFQRIAAGEEPCEEHTRASLIAAQIMDEIRLQCGLHFPADVD